MNAKQRRRFVRQYKEAINFDRIVCRLECSAHWFDSANANNLHRYSYDGEPVVETIARLNYYYALYIKGENANEHL